MLIGLGTIPFSHLAHIHNITGFFTSLFSSTSGLTYQPLRGYEVVNIPHCSPSSERRGGGGGGRDESGPIPDFAMSHYIKLH